MKDWFNEFLMVLTYSKRAQLAIVLGLVGYFLILVWGHYQLSNFELSGSMSSFSELIKQKLLQRYDVSVTRTTQPAKIIDARM